MGWGGGGGGHRGWLVAGQSAGYDFPRNFPPPRAAGALGSTPVGLRSPSQPLEFPRSVALVDHMSGRVGEDGVRSARGSRQATSRPWGCEEARVAGERTGCRHLRQGTQPWKLRESGEGPRPDHCVGWGGEIGRPVGVGMELEVRVGRKELETMPHHSSPHTHTHTHISTLTASSESLIDPWAL